MKVKVTEADMREAYARMHCGGFELFMAKARCMAAERLLEENAAETKRLCDESTAMLRGAHTHAEFRGVNDRIDKLFKEHDELLDLAFPRTQTGRAKP